MPCFLIVLTLISTILAVKIPRDPEFSGWLEKELMKILKVDKHENLKKALDEMYQKDRYSLKLMIEDLIILYKMKKKKAISKEDTEQQQAYVV